MAVYIDGNNGNISCSCNRTICDYGCHLYVAKMNKPNTVVGYVPPLKKTNADRVRSMSDEELAEWMSANARKYTSLRYSETGVIEDYGDHGLIAKRWLDWLKEETTDD